MLEIKRPFAVSACAVLFTEIFLMICGHTAVFSLILIMAVICTAAVLLKTSFTKYFILFLAFSITAGTVFSAFSITCQEMSKINGYNIEIQGTVTEYPEISGTDSYKFTVKNAVANNCKLYGKITVYCAPDINIRPGDKICFIADSLIPENGEGIYKYHSLSNKTYLTAFVYKNDITVTEKYEGNNILYKIPELRKFIIDKLFANMSEDNAAVAAALITGEKTYLSEELDASLKISGVAHIFAVSGMHLALWTNIFFIFFRQRARVSKLMNIAAILFVLFYIVFTGFSPSVIRAGIMLITVFISKIIKRRSDLLNSWGLAGTLMALFNPFLAGNVSFLLSYVATFALMFLSQYALYRKRNVTKKKLRKIKLPHFSPLGTLAISAGVLLMTVPVSALFFGAVSLLSPVSSLILTPLAELLMLVSGSALIFPKGNFISAVLFAANEFFSELIIDFIAFMKNFDAALIPVDKFLIIPWFIVSAIAVSVVIFIYKNRKSTLISILVCAMALLGISVITELSDTGKTTVYIPAGENATCIAFSFPDKKALLYGTGGSYKTCADTASFFGGEGKYIIDDLIIPRINDTENNNTDYIQRKLLPKNTLIFTEENSSQFYSAALSKDTEIHIQHSNTFSAAIFYSKNIKTVICSLPTSDFSDADSRFLQGDILICRNKVPETLNENNFGTVIVMTDKDLFNPSDNTVSTKDRSIKIKIKGDSYAINR